MGIDGIVEESISPRKATGPRFSLRERWPGLLIGLLFAVAATFILTARFFSPDRVALQPNDVSPSDIRAPRAHHYVSELLTEETRRSSEAAVSDVYDPPMATIRPQQVARAREVLDYISSVRYDLYASPKDQAGLIRAIPDVTLSSVAISRTLALDDEAWLRVISEVPLVVNRAMREEIREHQLPLARRNVESMIGLQVELSDEELEVVSALSKALLQPNSFYNEEKTEAARQAAREAVEPIAVSFAEGEIIVRAGDIVDELDVEALEQMGLHQGAWDWWQVAGTAIFVLTLTAVIWLYLFYFARDFWKRTRWPLLLASLMLVFLLLAKVILPLHALLPFFFPLAALAMILGSAFDLRVATLVTLCFGLVFGYLTDGSPEIVTYAVVGALVGAYMLRGGEGFGSFFRAGGSVALAGMLVLSAFRLPEYSSLDAIGVVQLVGAALANGVLAASLTLLGFYLMGTLFGISTMLQLIDVGRPTHPLLNELTLKTPGTYHHSIQIGNLAVQAANSIGADGQLARVGSYYHDIGKIIRPHFYIENQIEGAENPFDRLDPYTSAQIIIGHVRDGLDLARKHRLPESVQAFIPEHHGTRLVEFFYNKALELADGDTVVREEDFRYPGPKPQSRETAIVMLADGCEAAVRANRPGSEEELDEMVRRIISQRLVEGQLDECDLTLRDLNRTRKAFVEVLRGVHHPRIKYPEPPPAIPEGTQPAAIPAETEPAVIPAETEPTGESE